jgi:hypothetical protein
MKAVPFLLSDGSEKVFSFHNQALRFAARMQFAYLERDPLFACRVPEDDDGVMQALELHVSGSQG